MRLSPRVAAAEAVNKVLHGRNLDSALAGVISKVAERDRGLTAEIAYGVCRWYYQLDAVVQKLLEKPLKPSQQRLYALLLVGSYQLLHTRIPSHAAVAETVNAVVQLKMGWARGLTNAVLRRLERERDKLLEIVASEEPSKSMLPEWLLHELREAWPAEWQALAEVFLQRPPMTLRVNHLKSSTKEYAMRLSGAGLTARPVKGVPSAMMLDTPVPVEQLPGFFEGEVSVQDAGAQVAAMLLAPQPGDQVLDACAAPGGKSCHLLEFQRRISELTAVDIDETRLARIRENLDRTGLRARLVAADVSQPGGDWCDRDYDRILLDVPCSATGVIRRHPDIRLLRKPGDIEELVRRQRQILNNVWSRLKPGGVLLYCTCSILPRENQMQVADFLGSHADAVEAKFETVIGRRLENGIQILPGENGMDGFYYAALEKRA